MLYVEVQDEEVPALGFGTWELTGKTCYKAVRHALEVGYRHIDTARMYGNEKQVGKAIADAGVDRDEIFLTTKVWRDELDPRGLRLAIEDSLDNLDVEYLDLVLIHWPTESMELRTTMGAMEAQLEAGTTRFIGVSNFPSDLLEEAVALAPVFTDQVEYHPFLDQDAVLDVCRTHGMMLTAYSPLARGRVLEDPKLAEIASDHGKTPAQVAVRWLLQQELVSAIPRSSDPEHIEANFDVFDFELSKKQMKEISKLGEDERIVDPGFAPDWDG